MLDTEQHLHQTNNVVTAVATRHLGLRAVALEVTACYGSLQGVVAVGHAHDQGDRDLDSAQRLSATAEISVEPCVTFDREKSLTSSANIATRQSPHPAWCSLQKMLLRGRCYTEDSVNSSILGHAVLVNVALVSGS
jgi:hypothetical protein